MLTQHIAYQTALTRHSKSRQQLHLYALVDGLEYERLFQDEIVQDDDILPLFIQPTNQEVAFAGPWLINIKQIPETTGWQNKILQLEQTYPAVSWLITSLSFTYLFNHLERRLHLRLEDHRYALLRYYDPRVLNQLPTVFTPAQFEQFTLQIDEWIYYHNNQYFSLMSGAL